MKNSTTILFAASTFALLSLSSTSALACNGGYGYRSYSTPHYPQNVEHAYITIPPQTPLNGLPPNPQLTPGMQFRAKVANPNGGPNMSLAPMGMPPQGFTGGLPQGIPQGAQAGTQAGTPLMNGFAPQSQSFAQQLPNGIPQGSPLGPQAQAFGPQQLPGNLPQGVQPGPQSQPSAMAGPVGPQPTQGDAKNGDSIARRIADELTGLPGLPGGPPAGASAGPADRPMPSILVGSIMTINGQPLGDNRGTVRLIVNGSPVPLEILEWSASAAKVRIPADLPTGVQVQIEIVRADGSFVTKDTVKLVAGQPMAAAK